MPASRCEGQGGRDTANRVGITGCFRVPSFGMAPHGGLDADWMLWILSGPLRFLVRVASATRRKQLSKKGIITHLRAELDALKFAWRCAFHVCY